MQVQRRLVAAIAVLAGMAVPCADGKTHSTRVLRTDAKVMVLQLSDLPAGFGLQDGAYISNAQLMKRTSTRKDFRGLGRLTGYDVTYAKRGVAGVLGVDAFASIYRSEKGAHDSFLVSMAGAQKKAGSSFKQLSAEERLGSEARLFLATTTEGGMKVDFYTVAWRHGPVFAEVMGGGLSGKVDPAQVIALAQKQELRIAKALA
jgi:hypothetical protein